ncbi:unnamed protein product [Hermetia illucens]|uniref:Chitin-binding type-2 domain-containing protein n=1 Tax=Hermetia illucens TaxID=343691 RepID=A0A7R8UGZ2_HERIL|nr:unnamed protein product [Hermetia illucens]
MRKFLKCIAQLCEYKSPLALNTHKWKMKIHLQIKAVFLCGLLIHLWGANAQSCTSGATSPSADCDPHNFNLCVDGKEVLTKCPSSQSRLCDYKSPFALNTHKWKMKIHLQIKAVFLCGLLIHLWGADAESCTESYPKSGDPHFYTLICPGDEEIVKKCPSSQLYVEKSSDLENCQSYYGGCSTTLEGCVDWQKFPWPAPSAIMTVPTCSSIGPVAPYSDPSNYWFCTSIYGTAQLRSCPTGYGFSTRRIFGCARWSEWNMRL